MTIMEDQVRAALADVIDPCSVTAGAPLSVLDMGMILNLRVEDSGRVSIEMRATSAMCTMIAGIMKIAEDRVAQVEGVNGVDVKLRSGPMWTEADMTEKGRSILNERRRLSRTTRVVKPHEWKTRVIVQPARSSSP